MTDPDKALDAFLATRFNQDSLRKIAQEWHEERTGMTNDERAARVRSLILHLRDVAPELHVVPEEVAYPPAVAPLGPGETVTIPAAQGTSHHLQIRPPGTDNPVMAVWFLHRDRPVGDSWLDAAGVDRLIEACRRWQKAQEGK